MNGVSMLGHVGWVGVLLIGVEGGCGGSGGRREVSATSTEVVAARGLVTREEAIVEEGRASVVGAGVVGEAGRERGRRFGRLAEQAGVEAKRRAVSEVEVMGLLGPPDYWAREGEGVIFAYVYGEERPGDSVVVVRVDEDHLVVGVGFRGAGEGTFEGWRRYEGWPALVTTVARRARG